MDWISFDHQLPEKHRQVLIYFPEYFKIQKHFYAVHFFIDKQLIEGATHWMPLPEPPKE